MAPEGSYRGRGWRTDPYQSGRRYELFTPGATWNMHADDAAVRHWKRKTDAFSRPSQSSRSQAATPVTSLILKMESGRRHVDGVW